MFNHVQDDVLRWVLVTGIQDHDLLAVALRASWSALEEDSHNEDVPFEVWDERGRNLAEADEQWLWGNYGMCVLHLRGAWLV